MKRLILMRHAQAEEGPNDHDRPLSLHGRTQCAELGELLTRMELQVDHVVSSSAARAQQSAELVAERLGFGGGIEVQPALYLAEPEEILASVCNCSARVDTLLVVGHNPGISTLASRLRGGRTHLGTAGHLIAELDITDWMQARRQA